MFANMFCKKDKLNFTAKNIHVRLAKFSLMHKIIKLSTAEQLAIFSCSKKGQINFVNRLFIKSELFINIKL